MVSTCRHHICFPDCCVLWDIRAVPAGFWRLGKNKECGGLKDLCDPQDMGTEKQGRLPQGSCFSTGNDTERLDMGDDQQ